MCVCVCGVVCVCVFGEWCVCGLWLVVGLWCVCMVCVFSGGFVVFVLRAWVMCGMSERVGFFIMY
jgi:hypothetical protein